jgi:Spy/CpxP family protein refolding chaperone
MRKLNMMLVAGMVVLAAGLAAAQPQPPSGEGGRRGPPPPPPPLELLLVEQADELGLTDGQVAQIEALAEAARSELDALHGAVADAFRAGTLAEFLAADEALHERRLALRAAVLGVLTEDQWRVLQQVLPPPPPGPPGPPPCPESGRGAPR